MFSPEVYFKVKADLLGGDDSKVVLVLSLLLQVPLHLVLSIVDLEPSVLLQVCGSVRRVDDDYGGVVPRIGLEDG